MKNESRLRFRKESPVNCDAAMIPSMVHAENGMPNIYQGSADAKTNGRFAVIVSRFNESITTNLMNGAVETLRSHGVPDERIDVAWTPGAFEIPTVANQFAAGGRYAAIICLGAVVRGETTHDQHINRAVSASLCEIGVHYGLPILFGILTCNTLEQAIARSGGSAPTTGKDVADVSLGNKGVDCALAALEMVDLMKKLVNSGSG
jgi:6,7-dimethyl-8-ribityllumazine synthase